MVQLRPQPGALIRLLAPKPDVPDSERENPSFPLQFRKRSKGLGYYLALGVVVLVFSIPWVCAAWVVVYGIWARKWEGVWGAAAFLGFLYATAEVSTSIHSLHSWTVNCRIVTDLLLPLPQIHNIYRPTSRTAIQPLLRRVSRRLRQNASSGDA
jgi:hypothetical protein